MEATVQIKPESRIPGASSFLFSSFWFSEYGKMSTAPPANSRTVCTALCRVIRHSDVERGTGAQGHRETEKQRNREIERALRGHSTVTAHAPHTRSTDPDYTHLPEVLLEHPALRGHRDHGVKDDLVSDREVGSDVA